MTTTTSFMGFRRPNGDVGIRNTIAIIPSCGCALHVATQIANRVPGAVLLDYDGGCSQIDSDMALASQRLAQFGTHPNVAGSIVVSLGCETLDAEELTHRIAAGPAPTELLVIQQEGGTRKTINRGVELASSMAARASKLEREICPISSLRIGLECGGSDATSGIAANPTVGAFSDLIVAAGGQVILGETSEIVGAEHILAKRAVSPDVAQALVDTVARCVTFLKSTGDDFMGKQPSPGNVKGGITTVEEKALGDILKAGTSPLIEVLGPGQSPSLPGFSFMDTPGNDPASVTDLVAAGCQIVVFTTGRGNPMGNPVAPVVKITGNHATYQRMGEDIDLDVSTIIRGRETIAQAGQRLLATCLKVAEGQTTAAEDLGHTEFAIVRHGPVY